MERFCTACRRSERVENIAEEKIDEAKPENEIEGMEKKSDSFIQCIECKAYMQSSSFSPE